MREHPPIKFRFFFSDFIIRMRILLTFLAIKSSLLSANVGKVASNPGPSTPHLDFKMKISSWSDREKIAFHKNLVKLIQYWGKKTKYQKGELPLQWSSQFIHDKGNFWKNIFISQALASEQGEIRFCHFAGWMSVLNKKGQCIPPWRGSLHREYPHRLSPFGPLYDKSFRCGGANLFRCNPLIFGAPEQDPKGHCVETSDRNPSKATQDCLAKLDEEKILDLWETLESDPQKLEQFLNIAEYTVKFCSTPGLELDSEYKYCQRVTRALRPQIQALSLCLPKISLYPNLISLMKNSNLTQIYDLTRNWIRENRPAYEKALEDYRNHSKTQSMIKTLRKNLSRCLRNSCDKLKEHGKSNGRSKPKHTPTGKCARYLQYGLSRGENNYLAKYPWEESAKNMGKYLEEAGFINLMDGQYAVLGFDTPETAPEGAVIVYEGGKHGHIEVRAGEEEYLSDFTAPFPGRQGGERRPIGIYVKLPEDSLNNVHKI